MKNKSWIDIAKTIDLGYQPKNDQWHFERDAKKAIDKVVLSQAGAPTSGYSTGNLAMSLGNALANSIYRQLNSFLMAPFFTDVTDIANRYKQFMDVAPAGPDIMDYSLSGIPMTEVTMVVGKEGTSGPPTADLYGGQTRMSTDYNCFMTGYQKLWKYQYFAARFWRMYEKYLLVKDNSANGDLALDSTSLGELATVMSSALSSLEKLFRVCLCNSFKDCGLTLADDADQKVKDAYSCNLGGAKGDIFAHKMALSAGTSDVPTDIMDLLKQCTGGEAEIQNIITQLQQATNRDAQSALGYFFKNVQILYAQTVQNTSDWSYSQLLDEDGSINQGKKETWRSNSMLAFRLFVYSFCQISQTLREMQVSYYNLTQTAATTDGVTNCTAGRAAWVYCRWLLRVFYRGDMNSENTTNSGWDGSVPSYIINATAYIKACAANQNACNDGNDDLWKKFDFADISLPRVLSQNSS
jgi:hypothetical protein